MARSFRDLIDYLLNEISLCGDFGASPSDVRRFIKEFYNDDRGNDALHGSTGSVSNGDSQFHGNGHGTLIDDAFQERVWLWLTRHPEVSVGKNREGNGLTLSEVEATHSNSRTPATSENVSRNDQKAEPGEAARQLQQIPEHRAALQVFVSPKRMWLAVAGHEPDFSRLPPLEFALLSIIALHKGKGILQPELTQLSGQDKRSVPKRTDKLAAKGYIEKKAVQFKASRTSLCTLKRFAGTAETENEDDSFRMIDFKSFLDKIFAILKEHQVVTRNDLKQEMGMESRRPRKILSRAIRKLERIGCLERVKAVSQYSDIMKTKAASVRLIREPTEEDLRLFYEDSRSMVEVMARGDGERDAEGERDADEENEGIITPSWSPDEPLYNQLFSLIERSGTQGMTNLEIVKSSTGMFYRRPMENLMGRLVENWPYSQPLHLRKFAIIRDSAIMGTVSHYVHYTLDNFRQLVAEGKASWEVVEQVFPASSKKGATKPPPLDAVSEVDEYGFPKEKPSGLVNGGNASLRECLIVSKPVSDMPNKGEFTVAKRPDGSRQVVDRRIVSATPQHRPSVSGEGATQGRQFDESLNSPLKRKAIDQGEGDDEVVEVQSSARAPVKKQKRGDLHTGMSEKERLEAIGMDMSWTEYAALVIPRPTAGAYLTPFGKKRPTGLARGRPKKSRILIVKSERLRDFEWFQAGEPQIKEEPSSGVGLDERQDTTYASQSQSQPATREASDVVQEHGGSRKRKRAVSTQQQDERHVPSPQEVPVQTGDVVERETMDGASRRRSEAPVAFEGRDSAQASVAPQEADGPAGAAAEIAPQSLPVTSSSEVRFTATEEPILGATTAAQNRHQASPARTVGQEAEAAPSEEVVPLTSAQSSQQGPVATDGSEQTNGQSEHAARESVTSTGRTRMFTQPRRRERGLGSVAMIRRKIIFDILDKCQGMYPLGSSLWYPFTTAWLKATTQTGKPDLRTIKAAVKTLVDSGKIRQLTFSGRNSKGMLVTRSMITKPEISSKDPKVLEMQRAILSADPAMYIPSEADVDQTLRKSHKSLMPLPPLSQRQQNEEITVVMRHTPQRVRLAEERLRSRAEYEAARLKALQQRVQRLATTHRRPGTAVALPPRAEREAVRRSTPQYISKLSERGLLDPQLAAMAMRGQLQTLPLPKTLPEILSAVDFNAANKEEELNLDSRSARFCAEVDAVQQWENETFELYDYYFEHDQKGSAFVNHHVPGNFEPAPLEGPLRWERSEVYKGLIPLQTGTAAARRYERRKSQLAVSARGVSKDKAQGPVQKQRRLAALERQLRKRKPDQKTSVSRRSRLTRAISTDLMHKIVTALVVVRTLAGGNDGRAVDWALVQAAFPESDPDLILARGKSLLSRNRLQISRLQTEFQERFLEAYELGHVPPIDYNHIEEYDWAWVVDWAAEELEFSGDNRLPELPLTRSQFNTIFDIRPEQTNTLDEIYQHNNAVTIPRKQHLYASVPFAFSLPVTKKRQEPAHMSRLSTAKTWVRANIVAPDESYNPQEATKMLAHLDGNILAEAKQSLVQECVIAHRNKGRFIPGRNYDLTDKFVLTLGRHRQIDSVQLKRAATFKLNILDSAFHTDGNFVLKYDAEDGDILALMNLFQENRIEFHPLNPPKDKYGLTDGGYLTRMMDKSKLKFDVEIRPVKDRYMFGNPLQGLQDIPRGELPHDFPASALEHPPCNIPLWFDIHGKPVHILWQSAAAAVAGLVASQPGVGVGTIARILHPCLGEWEVKLILDYMVAAGIIDERPSSTDGMTKADCTVYSVKEWWWMIIHSDL